MSLYNEITDFKIEYTMSLYNEITDLKNRIYNEFIQ